MNPGIDVPQIQRFGALYIASARLKSMSKWRTIIAAVDIGNPLFYLIATGLEISGEEVFEIIICARPTTKSDVVWGFLGLFGGVDVGSGLSV